MARPRKEEPQIELSEESQIQEEIQEVVITPQLELSEELIYNVEVINANKHLKLGQTFRVSGNVAKNLLSKNLIKIL